MKKNRLQIALTIAALIIGAFSISKAISLSETRMDFNGESLFTVTNKYYYKTQENGAKIKWFIPQSNNRQQISKAALPKTMNTTASREPFNDNVLGEWLTSESNTYGELEHSFTFTGKSKHYALPKQFDTAPATYHQFLVATDFVQVHHPRIAQLAKDLTQEASNDKTKLEKMYAYVANIPTAPIRTRTDAVSVLDRKSASCNGKSRLFLALTRNLGMPSRLKGGIVLENTSKRTSHVWVEVFINGQWVPFDTTNNHFAYLPAHYLEIYQGDEALLSRSTDMEFDYTYDIQEESTVQFMGMAFQNVEDATPFSLVPLVKHKLISEKNLFLLLMLPLGGFFVAFLRNVVGLRTFGVFLPVLIAFSLFETGYGLGLLLFLFLIFLVGAVSRPFQSIGLLHTPKLVISLSVMVVIMLLGSYLGWATQTPWLSALTFFPIIILTISAEKFSNLIVEDGFGKASGILFQTLIAVSFCYLILSVKSLGAVLMLFPEVILFIILGSILLGRYVGFRWTELIRFKPLLDFKTI
ncbi:7TM domain-containing protein [Aureisphaera galaxeae]|uniref:7TM domain-containing protein n=1 Tax=Aureisphaera galaxeae TaxID=1538023 RepID=UPI002350B2EB|nr:7TM domain-containing protein [Aureisphaera galaxeae]MDC8002860.1 7TM domain-containing protein [Aureisphaera galaxeae]